MTVKFILEFLVLIGALLMGARAGGVGLGLWGAVGLLVLVAGFGVAPGAIPGQVLIIVLTVIVAASAIEVAGGMDFLVRKNPKHDRRSTGDLRLHVRFGYRPHCLSAAAGHLRSRPSTNRWASRRRRSSECSRP
jgi:anaerobic C4-dicarboxylate transporter DcuA